VVRSKFIGADILRDRAVPPGGEVLRSMIVFRDVGLVYPNGVHALDGVSLQGALGDLVERHESLRTIFPEREGVAHQEILAASAVRARLVVSAVSEAMLAAALGRAAGEGFDLSAQPPLRAHLFELSARAHVLLLLLHHIAGDGWSLAPLLGDLAHCYAARRSGQAPGLAPLPAPYADHSLLQQEVLGQASEGALATARQPGF